MGPPTKRRNGKGVTEPRKSLRNNATTNAVPSTLQQRGKVTAIAIATNDASNKKRQKQQAAMVMVVDDANDRFDPKQQQQQQADVKEEVEESDIQNVTMTQLDGEDDNATVNNDDEYDTKINMKNTNNNNDDDQNKDDDDDDLPLIRHRDVIQKKREKKKLAQGSTISTGSKHYDNSYNKTTGIHSKSEKHHQSSSTVTTAATATAATRPPLLPQRRSKRAGGSTMNTDTTATATTMTDKSSDRLTLSLLNNNEKKEKKSTTSTTTAKSTTNNDDDICTNQTINETSLNDDDRAVRVSDGAVVVVDGSTSNINTTTDSDVNNDVNEAADAAASIILMMTMMNTGNDPDDQGIEPSSITAAATTSLAVVVGSTKPIKIDTSTTTTVKASASVANNDNEVIVVVETNDTKNDDNLLLHDASSSSSSSLTPPPRRLTRRSSTPTPSTLTTTRTTASTATPPRAAPLLAETTTTVRSTRSQRRGKTPPAGNDKFISLLPPQAVPAGDDDTVIEMAVPTTTTTSPTGSGTIVTDTTSLSIVEVPNIVVPNNEVEMIMTTESTTSTATPASELIIDNSKNDIIDQATVTDIIAPLSTSLLPIATTLRSTRRQRHNHTPPEEHDILLLQSPSPATTTSSDAVIEIAATATTPTSGSTSAAETVALTMVDVSKNIDPNNDVEMMTRRTAISTKPPASVLRLDKKKNDDHSNNTININVSAATSTSTDVVNNDNTDVTFVVEFDPSVANTTPSVGHVVPQQRTMTQVEPTTGIGYDVVGDSSTTIVPPKTLNIDSTNGRAIAINKNDKPVVRTNSIKQPILDLIDTNSKNIESGTILEGTGSKPIKNDISISNNIEAIDGEADSGTHPITAATTTLHKKELVIHPVIAERLKIIGAEIVSTIESESTEFIHVTDSNKGQMDIERRGDAVDDTDNAVDVAITTELNSVAASASTTTMQKTDDSTDANIAGCAILNAAAIRHDLPKSDVVADDLVCQEDESAFDYPIQPVPLLQTNYLMNEPLSTNHTALYGSTKRTSTPTTAKSKVSDPPQHVPPPETIKLTDIIDTTDETDLVNAGADDTTFLRTAESDMVLLPFVIASTSTTSHTTLDVDKKTNDDDHRRKNPELPDIMKVVDSNHESQSENMIETTGSSLTQGVSTINATADDRTYVDEKIPTEVEPSVIDVFPTTDNTKIVEQSVVAAVKVEPHLPSYATESISYSAPSASEAGVDLIQQTTKLIINVPESVPMATHEVEIAVVEPSRDNKYTKKSKVSVEAPPDSRSPYNDIHPISLPVVDMDSSTAATSKLTDHAIQGGILLADRESTTINFVAANSVVKTSTPLPKCNPSNPPNDQQQGVGNIHVLSTSKNTDNDKLSTGKRPSNDKLVVARKKLRALPIQSDRTSNIQINRPNINKIKLLIYTTGKLAHHAHTMNYDKLFCDYWTALSRRLDGPMNATEMIKNRNVLHSFLKAKPLRKLHNQLILGLMERCLNTKAPVTDIFHSVPRSLRDRISIVNVQSAKAKRKELDDIPTMTDTVFQPQTKKQRATAPAYAPTIIEPTSTVERLQLKISEKTSMRVPGVLVIDPIVRKLAESHGLKVAEHAVWLLTIAVKEFSMSLLYKSLSTINAVSDGHVPPHLTRFFDTADAVRRTESLDLSKCNESNSPKNVIRPSDLHTIIANLPISSRSLSGIVSRTSFERSLGSVINSSLALGGRAFDELKQHIISKVTPIESRGPSGCVHSSVPLPTQVLQNIAAHSFQDTSPDRLSPTVRGLGRGAKSLASMKARTSNLTIRQDVDQSTPSLKAVRGEHITTIQASPLGHRNSAVKPMIVPEPRDISDNPGFDSEALERVSGSSDNSDGKHLTQDARRGKGYGVKNLAAMRARSVTSSSDIVADLAEVAAADAMDTTNNESSVKPENDVEKSDINKVVAYSDATLAKAVTGTVELELPVEPAILPNDDATISVVTNVVEHLSTVRNNLAICDESLSAVTPSTALPISSLQANNNDVPGESKVIETKGTESNYGTLVDTIETVAGIIGSSSNDVATNNDDVVMKSLL